MRHVQLVANKDRTSSWPSVSLVILAASPTRRLQSNQNVTSWSQCVQVNLPTSNSWRYSGAGESMKPTSVLFAIMGALLLTTCVSRAVAKQKAGRTARISRAEAAKIAAVEAPLGGLKGSELEKEDGKRVWCLDHGMPGRKDITEVQVDALTGEVICVVEKTPARQVQNELERRAEKKIARKLRKWRALSRRTMPIRTP